MRDINMRNAAFGEELYSGMVLLPLNDESACLTFSERELLVFYCREGSMTCSENENRLLIHTGETVVKPVMGEENQIYVQGSGLVLRLILSAIPENLSKIADGIDFPLKEWCEQFFHTRKHVSHFAGDTMFCGDSELRTVYSHLLSLNKNVGFRRLGLLELFVTLGEMEMITAGSGTVCPRGQQQLAHRTAEYLQSHMDGRVTLAELAEHFHVSGTQLKLSFKAVYGTSVYSYIRTRKMETAARLLLETDFSVLEIAGQLGYENGSKFASAFRAVMGHSPSEFRKKQAV